MKCRFDKKAGGSALNFQEVIAVKFQKMKEKVKKRRSRGVVGESNHILTGKVIPSLDNVLDE